MDAQSWSCTSCASVSVTTICSCGIERDVFLCSDCIAMHSVENPDQIHISVPIAAYGQHKVPGYFNRLQERSALLSAGKEELLGNLQALEVCQEELRGKVESVIVTLREFAEVTINKLQLLRAELERQINAAIQEVDAAFYLEKPSLKEKLAKELWDFGNNFKSLQLFIYQVDQSPFPASLDDILHYSLSTISGEIGFLPGISGNSLRLYDLRGGPTKEVRLPVTLTRGSVCCVIEGRTVMFVGGEPDTSETFALSLENYQITALQSMRIARGWPGIIPLGAYVYVFGGFSGPRETVSCEKYNIVTRLWAQLPDMYYPRCAFTPCQFEGEIYLPGIFRTHTALEAFSLIREEFRILPVPFPYTGYDSVSYIFNEELIMVSRRKLICRWTMNSNERNFRVSNATNTGEFVLSNCPPVLVGKDLYWVQNESGNLHVFNLEKKTISLALR